MPPEQLLRLQLLQPFYSRAQLSQASSSSYSALACPGPRLSFELLRTDSSSAVSFNLQHSSRPTPQLLLATPPSASRSLTVVAAKLPPVPSLLLRLLASFPSNPLQTLSVAQHIAMRDPRLATSHSTSPFASFPSNTASSHSPSTTASAAATTYLASREQHLQGPFSSQPHPHYQRPRMDQRPSRHPEAPTPVRWTTSTSSLQDTPAPPPPVHRVYVLRCASCDTFLSDRGMRVGQCLPAACVLRERAPS